MIWGHTSPFYRLRSLLPLITYHTFIIRIHVRQNGVFFWRLIGTTLSISQADIILYLVRCTYLANCQWVTSLVLKNYDPKVLHFLLGALFLLLYERSMTAPSFLYLPPWHGLPHIGSSLSSVLHTP